MNLKESNAYISFNHLSNGEMGTNIFQPSQHKHLVENVSIATKCRIRPHILRRLLDQKMFFFSKYCNNLLTIIFPPKRREAKALFRW